MDSIARKICFDCAAAEIINIAIHRLFCLRSSKKNKNLYLYLNILNAGRCKEENPCESHDLGGGNVAVIALHRRHVPQDTDRKGLPGVYPVPP